MPATNPTERSVEEWRLRELAAGTPSVLSFVPRLWPNFHRPDHLTPLAAAFARAALGDEVRVLSSAPPRFGKSTLIGAAIARHLLLRPDQTIMLIAYASDLAVAKSRMIRDAVVTAGLMLHPDARRADHWRTSAGGGVIACGVLGGITGHGANLLVTDDLYRGRPEAESQTIRDSVEQWLRGTAMTRLEPGAGVIVNSTRWHIDDMHGRLEAEGGWEVINIDCFGADGESIWPQRWSTEELGKKERALGSYDFFSQFRGAPVPPGGAIFDGDAATYDWPNVETGQAVIAVDPATSSSTRADHSVIIAGVAHYDANGFPVLDVIDVWRKQAEPVVLIDALKRISEHWGHPVVGIESVAGFRVLVGMARQAGVQRVMEMKAVSDKLSRALPAAAAWSDGRIRLPAADTPWKRPFTNEVRSFTGVGDRFDDQVDALSHAFTIAGMLGRPGARGRRSRAAPFLPFG